MSNIISKRLANIIGTASTIPNFIGTNISTSTLNTGNLTTGNINFTGTIYQNGIPYVGSQWTTTQGSNLSYTSGSVVIQNMLSVGSLRSTESSIGTLNAGNLTTGNINFTGILSQNGVAYVGSQWTSTQGSSLSYTSGTVVIETMLSAGNARITNLTTANILYNNLTVSNLVTNNVNLGVSSLYSGSMIAANNVPSPTSVTGLLFNSANVRYMEVKVTVTVILSVGDPLIQAYTLFCYYNTAWSLLSDSIGDTTTVVFSIDSSTGQVYYTSTNISNWTSTTIRYAVQQFTSTGTYTSLLGNTVGSYILDSVQLNSTTNSILGTSNGAMYVLGGATIGKSVNIQATNVATAVGSGGSLTVFGGMAVSGNVIINSGANSSFNSNTLGNLYTTGGNVGIGNPNPSYSLDISGDIRANNGTFGGHLIPSSNITYDLGSTTNRWRDLYLSGSSINLGGTLISITGGGTQIAFGGSVFATTTTGNIASSVNNLVGSTASIGNVNFINISAGTLNAGNLTTGNINFTGILSQNGTAYVGSQWTSTTSNLSYTSGSVVIGSTLSAGTLISTTSTIGNLVALTGISTGTYSGTTMTIGNIVASIGISSGTYVGTSVSVSNINVSNTINSSAISVGNIFGVNTSLGNLTSLTGTFANKVGQSQTVGSLFISMGNLNISGGNLNITGGNINVNNTINSSAISVGNLYGVNTSLGNLTSLTGTFANKVGQSQTVGSLFISMGNLNISGGNLNITGGNINVSNTINSSAISVGNLFSINTSLGNLTGSTATIGNIVALTGISSGTYSGSTATIGNIMVSTGISSGTYVGTSVSVGNINVVNFSTSNLQISGNISGGSSVATIGTLRSSDIFVSGTLTSVNITTTNLLQSNGSLIANNITTGGLFVSTGGLISITVSSGTIFGSSSTIGNIVALTGISSGSYVGGSVTVTGVVNASTSTVPNVVHTNVTTSTLIAGGKLTGVGGTLLNNIQNSVSGTSSFGLGFWSDSNWAIYMGQSGGTRSFSNGAACNGASFLDFALRFRVFNSVNQGFIFENSSEQMLMSIRGSDGFITAPGGISTGSIQATSSTISNMVNTNTSSGTYSGTTATIGNIVATTNISSGTYVGTSISVGTLNGSLATISNIVSTNITTSNILSTNISTSQLRFSANATSGILFGAGPFSRIYDDAQLHIWTDDNMYFDVGGSSTAGSTRMFINSAGNIGIATTSPSYTVDVQGKMRLNRNLTVDNNILMLYDGSGGGLTGSSTEFLGFGINSDTLRYQVPTGQNHRFHVSAGNIVTINNVGISINTINPTSSLTVNPIVIDANNFNHSLAPVTITCNATTGTASLNDPTNGAVLHLCRQGKSGEAFGSKATFSLCRYENVSVDSRTRLDINLTQNSYTGPTVLSLRGDGRVGISNTAPTAMFQVGNVMIMETSGNLTVSGDVFAFGTISDKRLKENIIEIPDGIDIINSLRPITFNWKNDIFNEQKRGMSDSGFIAQEVETIIPHAVSEFKEIETGNIYKNMRHERIIPYLVKAIQELSEQVKELKEFL